MKEANEVLLGFEKRREEKRKLGGVTANGGLGFQTS
jgi:hypothetical protein